MFSEALGSSVIEAPKPMAGLDAMDQTMEMTVRIVMMVVLTALLVASLWFAYAVWTAVGAVDLPPWIYGAMAGGVGFSLLVGCGLMALVFYSSRYGYDDRV
jgi:hypothetical protein